MTITAADLVFFRAEQPHDLPSGGGRRTSIAVEGGAENNLFPDIAPAGRAAGAVQLRKFFPSVVSEDADVLMSAQVGLAQGPDDPALDVVLFAFGDQQTTRADAAREIARRPFVWASPYELSPGNLVAYRNPASVQPDPAPERALVVVAISADDIVTTADVGTLANQQTIYSVTGLQPLVAASGATRSGCAITTSSVVAGATTVSIDRLTARVLPAMSVYPANPEVIDGIETAREEGYRLDLGNGSVTGTRSLGLKQTSGHVPIFRVGGAVRVAGGGVSEVAIVSGIDWRGVLTLSAPIDNAYPSGSTVSSLLSLGDLAASVGRSFSQQTWTKTFSDSLIGQPIGANYDRSHAITTTNIGAITERWAIVFTGATAYKLIGERVGQVATGTTDAAFAPVNPLTNRPYFTIPPAGWGGGWATGNVLRFNTAGAYAPVWAVRTVSPSAPGGLDGSVIEMRGGVNA